MNPDIMAGISSVLTSPMTLLFILIGFAARKLRVMQDGVELWAYEGEQKVSEDENRMTGLSVGESTLIAVEYVLRSDSPVTCEYHEFGSSDPEIGAVYPCE